ncbi:MAG: ABC transporter ATP-binding protein [Candidatus Rokuibacteriota bacterium]
MAQAAEVRLEGVGKRYGTLWAVRDVTLRVARGAFYTLLGPSGCGKTTLLRMIAGFAWPDTGSIWLDDARIDPVPPWQRRVGLVFQNYALWPHLSVFENVAFGLREQRVRGEALRERVRAALRQVDLAGFERRRPSQLSGGQQQRVALARTLVVQPRVLLLDEPLSNLDAQLRAQMRSELARLQQQAGITTIYVTHDQSEALALSTRIAVLSGGVVVQEGTPWEVYHEPRSRLVAEFIGAANILAGVVASVRDGDVHVDLGRERRVRATPRSSISAPNPGDRLTLCLRPEALRMVEAAVAPAPAPTNTLSGRVVAAVFEGGRVRYEVDLDGDFTLRADVSSTPALASVAPGTRVTLAFEPSDARILAE